MTSPALLFHTIRHLRPTQVVSRVYYRAADSLRLPRRQIARFSESMLGARRWAPYAEFLAPPEQGNTAEGIGEGSFCFQKDERHLRRPVDWSCTEAPLLWRYHLHYFDYLWLLDFHGAKRLVEDWLDRHPGGREPVGWAPYPTSLRLMNWCGYFFGRHAAATAAVPGFENALRISIGAQTHWLTRRIEYHLLGNHLLENAAALAYVGSCFHGRTAERWRQLGLRLLRQELEEQILPDGMHFERSPMYHLRVLYVLLSLANVAGRDVRTWLRPLVARMLDALAATCHPDGEIALLNDSALGVYRGLHDLADFAVRLGVPWQHRPVNSSATFALPEAGYYGARNRQGHYVVCDAGSVGPDYIPGHAHGDIFSFELSLFGERIVVDSGVHDYETGRTRDYCRSTAAHNTVEINGEDQCEFWDAFKVGRRGRPRDVVFRTENRGFTLSGWHDGYRRLIGRPTHHREFAWDHQGAIAVRDTVVAAVPVSAVSRIHLHPECRVSERTETGLIVGRSGRHCTLAVEAGELSIGRAWYCPEFGVRQKQLVVELKTYGVRERLAYRLTPIGADGPTFFGSPSSMAMPMTAEQRPGMARASSQ